MKKILFVILCLFSFSLNVLASTLEGDIYVSNNYRNSLNKDSINIFNETYHGSGVMQYFYDNGKQTPISLNNQLGIGDDDFFNNKSLDISLMSVEDIMRFNTTSNGMLFSKFFGLSAKYNNGSFYGSFTNEGISIEHDSTFSINTIFAGKYLNDYSYSDITDLVVFSLNSESFIHDDGLSLYSDFKYIILFSGSHPIGFIGFGGYRDLPKNFDDAMYYIRLRDSGISTGSSLSSSYSSLQIGAFFQDSNVYKDMTSWYAFTFKVPVSVYSKSGVTKAYPVRFCLETSGSGTCNMKLVTDNAGYSGVFDFFDKQLWSSRIDLNKGYNLDFVYKDIFYNKDGDPRYMNLWDYWLESKGSEVPSDYRSLRLDTNKKGKFLDPISGCEKNDYFLYYKVNSSSSMDVIYANFYNLSNNDLVIAGKFGLSNGYANTTYLFNPLGDLNIDVDNFDDYVINFYQYNTKFDGTIYYNAACYNFIDFSDGKTLNFSNGSFTIGSGVSENLFNRDNINGNKYEPGSTSVSGSTNNPSQSDTSVLNPPSSDKEFNISSLIGNIGNYASSFFSNITALIGIVSTFFTGLPSEISVPLLAMFNIGLIVIIIKLFL